MITKLWTSIDGAATDRAVEEAAAMLRAGEVVAFPTETVYGLGANALDDRAVRRVFEAKGRPSDNPLIVHIADRGQLEAFAAEVPETARKLMDRFWPGPLTIVLPAVPGVLSPRVTAGLATVGVRMPKHETALRLIRAAGLPIAGPSANRSGKPSPTRAEHVARDLDGRIAGILDGGPCGVGVESTVVAVAGDDRVRILRPGGVTAEMLAAAGVAIEGARPGSSEAAAEPEPAGVPIAPGMKYAHYAPAGELTVVAAQDDAARTAWIAEALAAARQRGQRTGVLVLRGPASGYAADCVIACGGGDLQAAARELYGALRRFDEERIEVMFAEGVPPGGIGGTIMNRLAKAAGGRVVRLD